MEMHVAILINWENKEYLGDVGLGEPGSVAKESIIAQCFVSSSSPGPEVLNLSKLCCYEVCKPLQHMSINVVGIL
jgi:hypothetical protein